MHNNSSLWFSACDIKSHNSSVSCGFLYAKMLVRKPKQLYCSTLPLGKNALPKCPHVYICTYILFNQLVGGHNKTTTTSPILWILGCHKPAPLYRKVHFSRCLPVLHFMLFILKTLFIQIHIHIFLYVRRRRRRCRASECARECKFSVLCLAWLTRDICCIAHNKSEWILYWKRVCFAYAELISFVRFTWTVPDISFFSVCTH